MISGLKNQGKAFFVRAIIIKHLFDKCLINDGKFYKG